MLGFEESFYYFKDDTVFHREEDVSKRLYDWLLEDLIVKRNALSIEEVSNYASCDKKLLYVFKEAHSNMLHRKNVLLKLCTFNNWLQLTYA